MTGFLSRCWLVPLALAASALIGAGVATAQCADCAITPGDPVGPSTQERPLEIEFESTLNFDRLLLNGNGPGTARIDPDGGRDVAGSVESIGGRALVGRMILTGEPGRQVDVVFPDKIELIGISGAVITIRQIFSDLPKNAELDSNGRLVVQFGGELGIDGDSDGDFRGNLLIRADYL